MSAESVDPSRHLIRTFNKDKVPLPALDSEALQNFLNKASYLALEIGCGVGLHPMTWALRNPDKRILAIEKTAEKFKKFQKRFEDAGRPQNILPLHAHAVSVVAHFLKTQTVDECFILFPNPEPKSPQSRWIRMPFFTEILRCLKLNGKIHFATNEKNYHEEIMEFATKTWNLKLEKETRTQWNDKKGNALDLPTPRTHFEKKYLERGQTIYSTTWTYPGSTPLTR